MIMLLVVVRIMLVIKYLSGEVLIHLRQLHILVLVLVVLRWITSHLLIIDGIVEQQVGRVMERNE